MGYEFPDAIKRLIDRRLASGKYASEEDVLTKALLALDDFDEAIADIQAGIEDEKAGRLRPIAEVAAEIRQNHGFSQ